MKSVGFTFVFIFSTILQANSKPANIKVGLSNVVLGEFIFAIHNNQPEKVKSIIKSENIDMRQYSYLLHSVLDKPEVLEVLLEKGADPNVREGSNNNTPLYEIVLFPWVDEELVRKWQHSMDILLNYGADPNAGGGSNEYARTPFLLAAYNVGIQFNFWRVDAFISMLNSGGDLTDDRSKYRNTALHLVALISEKKDGSETVGLNEVVAAILEKGVRINALNRRGQTPLDMSSNTFFRDLLKINGGKRASELSMKQKGGMFAVIKWKLFGMCF